MLNHHTEDQLEKCPISLLIMRHPITVLPSNKTYELSMLLSHLENNKLICPLTRLEISSFTYNQDLKQSLDDKYGIENNEDRMDAYLPGEHESALLKLAKIIHPDSYLTTAAKATPKSLAIGLILSALSIPLFNVFSPNDEATRRILLTIAFLTACDFGTRILRRDNTFGLFSAGVNATRASMRVLQDIRDTQEDPDVQRRVFLEQNF